jgi:hypothetical protein
MGSDDGTSLRIARLLVFVRPLSLQTELDDSETGFFLSSGDREKRFK